MKKSLFLISSILLTLFTACSNLDIISTSSEYNIHGTLQIDDSAYRSAFPVVSNFNLYTTEIYYYKSTDTEASKKLLTKTTSEVFNASLQKGSWNLIAQTYTTVSYSTDNKVLAFKSETKTVTINDDSPVANPQIKLEFVQTEGTGSIDLSFTIATTTTLAYNYKLDGPVTKTYTEETFKNSATYTISQTALPVGEYLLTLSFYSTNGILRYQLRETVSVFSGSTTNTWYNTGNSSYFSTSGSTTILKITESCLNDFAQTSFYVDINAASGGNGNFFAPFNSINAAKNKVTTINKPCNIYLKPGTYEYSGTTAFNINQNLNIEVYTNTPGDKLGTATIKNTTTGDCNFITIPDGKTLSLSGITLDGNNTEKSTSNRHMGIIEINGADGIISKLIANNCIFKNGFNNTRGGAAIYTNSNKSNINVTNCQFMDCTFEYDGPTSDGGGFIYTKSNSAIFTNTQFIRGHVISLPNGSRRSAGYGGAILCDMGELTLNSCIITDCTVKSKYNNGIPSGGGLAVRSNPSVWLNSVSFSGCKTMIGSESATNLGNDVYWSMAANAEFYLFGEIDINDCYLYTLNSQNSFIINSTLQPVSGKTTIGTFTISNNFGTNKFIESDTGEYSCNISDKKSLFIIKQYNPERSPTISDSGTLL